MNRAGKIWFWDRSAQFCLLARHYDVAQTCLEDGCLIMLDQEWPNMPKRIKKNQKELLFKDAIMPLFFCAGVRIRFPVACSVLFLHMAAWHLVTVL